MLIKYKIKRGQKEKQTRQNIEISSPINLVFKRKKEEEEKALEARDYHDHRFCTTEIIY